MDKNDQPYGIATDTKTSSPFNRRSFIRQTTAAAIASLLAGCGGGGGSQSDSSGNSGGNGNSGTSASSNIPNPLPSGISVVMNISQQQIPNTATLSPGFASLSYEKSRIYTSPGVLLGAASAGLINLFNALKGGVLRIGANSVDRTAWTPNGAGQTSGQVSKADVANFAAFIKQCPSWKVVYGINFAGQVTSPLSASPALAADEAAYVAQQLGNQLLAFEIGNEPTLYGNSNSPGLAGITYDIFLNGGTVAQGSISGWNQFAAAIQSAVSTAVFSGPAASDDKKSWAENFAASESGKIGLITEHYYISNYNSATPSIAGMLAYPNSYLIAALKNLQATSLQYGLPYRIDECNSYFDSTNPAGVSNTFAAALWRLDFIFTHAQYGASGLNFHNNGSVSSYAAIGDSKGAITAVQPLYYALALFGQIFSGGLTGQLLASTLAASGCALSAFPVGTSDGATCVILNNKDTVNAANVTINTGRTLTRATLMPLLSAGSNPSAQLANLGTGNGGSAITLGSQAFGINGQWQGAPQQFALSGQSLTVNIPPTSAALLRLT